MVEQGKPGDPTPDIRPDLNALLPEVDRGIKELLNTNAKIFIASTGAGAGITQLIWRTPGISKILVGTAFPYHRNEFQRFVGREWQGPYVSEEAAIALSSASYERVLSAEDVISSEPIGIGLTAAVATTGNPSSESRVIIAARSRSKVSVVSASMERDFLDRIGEGFVSDLLSLNTILHVSGVSQVQLPNFHINSNELVQGDRGFVIQPRGIRR
jgi:hypothetical protein